MNSVRIIDNDLVPDIRDIVVDRPIDEEAYECIESALEQAREHKKNGKIPVPIILNETKRDIETCLMKRGYQVQDVHCEIDLFV